MLRRFSEMRYVPPDQVKAVALREDATPFDMPGIELGHQGVECSFDAFIRKYNLTTRRCSSWQ